MAYVDIVYCHRPDPFCPIEETVRAMNFVIEQGEGGFGLWVSESPLHNQPLPLPPGWAFYWGTSEWSAAELTEA